MMLKTITTAAIATSMVATPVLAQSATAARQATGIESAEEFGGGPAGFLIGLLALAAVVAALVIAIDESEEPEPASP